MWRVSPGEGGQPDKLPMYPRKRARERTVQATSAVIIFSRAGEPNSRRTTVLPRLLWTLMAHLPLSPPFAPGAPRVGSYGKLALWNIGCRVPPDFGRPACDRRK